MAPDFLIIAIASPYVHDVMESARRAGLRFVCVDNLETEQDTLPDHVKLRHLDSRNVPFIVGLSSPDARFTAYTSLFRDGFRSPTTLIDPTAVVASSVFMGPGVYVNSAAVIASNTRIECGTNINRSASIGHDNVIGHFASVGPGVTTAGGVKIGSRTLLGVGAVVKPEIRVGDDCTVGAGAVVVNDVPDGTTVVGNPARVVATSAKFEGLQCPFC